MTLSVIEPDPAKEPLLKSPSDPPLCAEDTAWSDWLLKNQGKR